MELESIFRISEEKHLEVEILFFRENALQSPFRKSLRNQNIEIAIFRKYAENSEKKHSDVYKYWGRTFC